MSKTKQILGVATLSLGLCLGLGVMVVSAASPASTLQPASTITYNEEVVVNNTLKTNSIQIGSTVAGEGGATYFNGSIVNAAVDEDGNSTIPVTIADDLRVDGEIYRTEKGGDDPLKISDNVIPTMNNTNKFGSSSYRWKGIYAVDASVSGTLTVSELSGDGVVSASNLASDSVTGAKIAAGAVGPSELGSDSVTASKIAAGAVGSSEIGSNAIDSSEIADGAVTTNDLDNDSVTSAKIVDGAITGSDIKNGTVTTSDINDGTITGDDIDTSAQVTVDVMQATGSLIGPGAVKALIDITGGGAGCTVNKSWTYNSSTVNCNLDVGGYYTVTIDNIATDDRYIIATSQDNDNTVGAGSVGGVINVLIEDSLTQGYTTGSAWVAVF